MLTGSIFRILTEDKNDAASATSRTPAAVTNIHIGETTESACLIPQKERHTITIGSNRKLLSTADSGKQVENTMKSIVSVMKAICVLFVLITLFVVVLVEVLLIKSKLIKERRNFGVQKALGFTTPQLIVQTMLINLPVIGAGALLGAVLSSFLFEPSGNTSRMRADISSTVTPSSR